MLRVALELLGALLATALLVRLLAPRLAFFPTTGETVTPRDFGVRFEAVSITTSDGEQLHGWKLFAPTPHAEVLYFHGNGGNLSVWAPVLAAAAQQGVSVFAVDYRGYGRSTGRPSERGLYRDVEAVVDDFGARKHANVPVIYWGRSLGVVMAAYAATLHAPDGLILEAGFPDARSIMRSSPVLAVIGLFSSYRFPCAAFLQRVRAPVLVMHGDHDRVIPIAQGRALF